MESPATGAKSRVCYCLVLPNESHAANNNGRKLNQSSPGKVRGTSTVLRRFEDLCHRVGNRCVAVIYSWSSSISVWMVNCISVHASSDASPPRTSWSRRATSLIMHACCPRESEASHGLFQFTQRPLVMVASPQVSSFPPERGRMGSGVCRLVWQAGGRW